MHLLNKDERTNRPQSNLQMNVHEQDSVGMGRKNKYRDVDKRTSILSNRDYHYKKHNLEGRHTPMNDCFDDANLFSAEAHAR